MSARKTPILLRESPLTKRIYALTRYRLREREALSLEVVGDGRCDVTADFDALVCELLLGPAPKIIEQLDGAARGMELTREERQEIEAFRQALVRLVERHNAGPYVKREGACGTQ
jgi:hypothetical protein